jgi:hypothetical protein
MTAVLTNTDINAFHEKLMIYNRNFFSVINIADGLLGETTTINEASVSLGVPSTAGTQSTYSIAQFSKFIKKVVNFNIKNYTEALGDTDLCFVNKDGSGNFTSNDYNRDHIIKTLKVVSVFVDILEAYKYCIDNASAATFDTGYTPEVVIERIELVSDKTRFYSGTTMTPPASDRNVGYIRKVTVDNVDKTVLYLSIQSFDTGMQEPNNKFDYNELFTKDGDAFDEAVPNILASDAKNSKTYSSPYKNTYKYQRYSNSDEVSVITNTGLTLETRNKNLIFLLIRTLFGLDNTFRKQSVNALYYYYKFVQLYTTLIIHISNVMYNDVKLTASDASRFRIETYNMTTNKKTHVLSGFEKQYITGDATTSGNTKVALKYEISGGGSPTPPATIADDTGSGANTTMGTIVRGKGYTSNPDVVLKVVSTSAISAIEKGRATIVPVVYAETSTTNENNIKRLQDVIVEINETITVLLDELSTYSETSTVAISTTPSDASADLTKVYALSPDKYVVIKVAKASIYKSLIIYKDKYDLVKDYIIYDKKNKYSYDILDATDNANDFEIKIRAFFNETDRAGNTGVPIFKSATDAIITGVYAKASASDISYTGEFLELRMKDTNSYKTKYINTRDAVSKLESDIGYKSSKVTHQNNLYESQNNKKIFLERQVLAYNIILAIILIILVAVNVGKVDKGVVKTVSLSCFGAIILLFVIYFISNMTYIETFAMANTDVLYDLSITSFTTNSSSTESLYTPKKIRALNGEITKLNTRFLGYFEKLIITLPASDNYDFYKEISEIITNDKENKEFIRDNLDYSKNQNDNNINSIKYELENNKLYINTLLISAVIFVGLYNLYINYMSEKYLYLLIFISFIIFVIILSYYYITANRRVKTVFKNIYWGPEFSKRF